VQALDCRERCVRYRCEDLGHVQAWDLEVSIAQKGWQRDVWVMPREHVDKNVIRNRDRVDLVFPIALRDRMCGRDEVRFVERPYQVDRRIFETTRR
jgi:hypothetical protein